MTSNRLRNSSPTERGVLAARELLLAQMPCYFGMQDALTNPGELPETCPLCWELLGPMASYRLLPCGHIFHLPCIDFWLCSQDTRCPLCCRSFYYLRRPRATYIAIKPSATWKMLGIKSLLKSLKARCRRTILYHWEARARL
ncbi:hypothetical protein BDV37DRAFT_266741 [Aspergillus pseudonomiae]|uniref:RING-type domain-containing protein n=1 Tax=Aspergillus pseudonomiae TaxID=1506151 RepID=A0A5N7CTM3_9EURO|nr:uncharacterized protein BDV37DRAFT_266741 [Aspergillus pseudonomiae]KAE8397057.1 hypothetical protein BDV37DRAFT_266741 [Aspergillus pseudonomiae]